MDFSNIKKLEKWAKELSGVVALSDLRVLYPQKSEAALYRILSAFIQEGVLFKIKRGLYYTKDANLERLSNRINPESYISTGTVLAKHLLIGSIPARKIQAVKVGNPRKYSCSVGIIEHLSISKDLFFGFETIGGIRYATKEKAFLDTCYYLYKQKTFSFDPATDVNIKLLDQKLIDKYLKKYSTKFLTFYRSVWK